MTSTAMLYATSARGEGLRGQPSYWQNAAGATGAPGGSWATNNNHWSPGYQRLVLGGYNPQAAILSGTGGRQPYSIDYLHVGVTFQLDSATNYDSVDVLLLDAGGQPIATQRLYLWDATTGTTVVGWVNFTGHNGYDAQQKLSWADLAGCQVSIELTRSGAAGTDTFMVDAVGMFAAYTLDAPTEPAPPPTPIQVQPPGGGVSLRVYDRDGNRLAILPWMSLSRAVVRNDVGSLSTTVPKALIPDGVLDGERYLRVAVNGVEVPEWYVLDDDGDDDADQGGTMRPVAIAGTGAGAILDWGVVYSWQYALPDMAALNNAVRAAQMLADRDQYEINLALNRLNMTKDQLYRAQQAKADQNDLDTLQKVVDAAQQTVDLAQKKLAVDKETLGEAANALIAGGQGMVLGLDPFQDFAGKTPGFIMAALIDQAKARGCFPNLSYSFTADVDSAGVGWPTTYSRKYDIGTSVLKVLTTMSEDGWVDWKMTGFTLDLYAADTTLAADHPEVVLRLGKGVTQAPRKRTRKTARSTILANGDQGATIEVADASALATWGRREGYEGRSGVTDYGTLTAATQVSLSRQTNASESFTLELDPYALPEETPALPRPGGYIRYDRRRLSPTQLEPLRVQSVAYDYGDPPKVSVELQDLWLDADVKRGRQLDAILNGSTANQRVPQPQEAPDTLAPAAVAGLGLESTAYIDPTGQLFAQMTATWAEVTRNVDNSPISDLAGYEIQWRQLDVGLGAQTISINALTKWQWSPVAAGVATDVRIRAVDRFDNPSDWSSWVTIMSGNDVTPPAAPSAPLVDNYLGLLRTRWDGAFAGGAPRANDLHQVEVHLSTVGPTFAPDPRTIENGGTLAGTLIAAGPVFRETPYGQTWWARLVAVDHTGNRSAPSAAASGATGQVVSADVFDGAVGSAKLADLAVITAKINDLAVNNAKIGSLDVGKLVAGTMTAQVILGGAIRTNANPSISGGVEINGTGIYAWSTSGAPTVAIDTQGNATLTGIYKTATSGRRIELGTTGNAGSLVFYSPTGIQQYLSSSSWDQGGGVMVEALSMRSGTQGLLLLTSDNTASMWGWKATTIMRDGFSVLAADSVLVNNQVSRLSIDSKSGTTSFGWGPGQGNINMVTGGGGYSPWLQQFTGDGFGNAMRVGHFGDGSVITEFTPWNGSGYSSIHAANVAVSSDARGKESIRDAGLSAVSLVKTAKVKRYVRSHTAHAAERDERGIPTGRPRAETALRNTAEEIGLLAQEAPAEIVAQMSEGRLGIDLYRMAALLWGAVHELDDRLVGVEEQRGKR